jgi:hypothetical protein
VSHPPIINPTHKVNIKSRASLALVSATGLDFTVNRRATSAIKRMRAINGQNRSIDQPGYRFTLGRSYHSVGV